MPTSASRGTFSSCNGTARKCAAVAEMVGATHAIQAAPVDRFSGILRSPPAPFTAHRPPVRLGQQSSCAKNRMREICTSGSVGGEGGNILAYPANRDGWGGTVGYAPGTENSVEALIVDGR